MSTSERDGGLVAVYRQGNKLIVARQAKLPDLCIRCGQPTTAKSSLAFSDDAQRMFAIKHLGPLGKILVAPNPQKAITLEVAACESCLQRRRRLRWTVAAPLLIGGIPVILVLMALFGPESTWWALLVGVLLLLGGAVFLDRADKGLTLTATYVGEKYAAFKGTGEDFLAHFPPCPQDLLGRKSK